MVRHVTNVSVHILSTGLSTGVDICAARGCVRRVQTPAQSTSPGDGDDEGEAVMSETWSGEFYCVKCKAKREASGEVKVSDKGTRMAKATCPVCSTNLNRILGRA